MNKHFDNMPENLQGFERGEASEEAIYEMEDVIDWLDTTIETINDIINV